MASCSRRFAARVAQLAVFLGLIGTPPAAADGFDAEAFETFTTARAGDGAPVYWYSVGTVRAFPSGEPLFEMEGYDATRAHQPDPDAPLIHQYNRKIYVFRDLETGEVLETYDGAAVEPIAYPYQFITYALNGERVETLVEQGAGDFVQQIGPSSDISARRVGDTMVFSAPVFLDFPLPGGAGQYEAWENYDFFIHPDDAVAEPHQLSWARVGPLPPWAGGGMSVMHLVTWRVESFEDVPERFRAYIDAEAPLWREPPADLAEIRRIQAGDTP